MNERALRPANLAAAAALIGGALVAFLPQHALSIGGVCIITIAAGAALHALARNAPAAWWFSPFDTRASIRRPRSASDDVALIRSRFAGARQQLPGGPALPPATIRMLRPLIAVALQRSGTPSDSDAARALLSPAGQAILNAPATVSWFSLRPPDERRTAAVVQDLLVELARLAPRHHDSSSRQQTPVIDHHWTRVT